MDSSSEPASFLLLLSPPPSPPTLSALRHAYGDTLSQVLKEVASASEETSQPAILDIALALPHLAGQNAQPRASLYAETQAVLAAAYKLVCLIAAKDRVNVQDSNGADVRILPIAWAPDSSPSSFSTSAYGPVIDLQCLAASQRQWQYAFGVESDEGEAFVRAFVAAKQAAANNKSKSTSFAPPAATSASRSTAKKHSHVAVGGTFDHLHIGHKLLLTMTAFALDPTEGEHIMTIGITGDELLKNKKYPELLESWSMRQQSVHRFLKAILDFSAPDAAQPAVQETTEPGPNGHVVNIRYPIGLTIQCVEIWDPYGPTITIKDISALIISAETRAGGKAVNDKRTDKGWSSLEVLEVDVLDAKEGTDGKSVENFQDKLSSTEIRKRLSEKL